MLKEVIPKDKNAFVIYQNMQKWMGFLIQVLYFKLRYMMCCHVALTVLLKIEITMPIHSYVFHNEHKNQDISPSSTAADYY